jgi:hypothetical protein
MSGIITGPYFKQFFNSPGPIEVGTMVAVLELGALGVSPFSFALRGLLTSYSYVNCSWSRGRSHRTQGDTLHRSPYLHHWWYYSDIHHRILRHDRWPSGKRLWSGALVVGHESSISVPSSTGS